MGGCPRWVRPERMSNKFTVCCCLSSSWPLVSPSVSSTLRVPTPRMMASLDIGVAWRLQPHTSFECDRTRKRNSKARRGLSKWHLGGDQKTARAQLTGLLDAAHVPAHLPARMILRMEDKSVGRTKNPILVGRKRMVADRCAMRQRRCASSIPTPRLAGH